MSSRRLAVFAATAVLALAAAPSARAQGDVPIGSAECWGLTDCVSVVSPWVEAADSTTLTTPTYNWSLTCPRSRSWAAGIDGSLRGRDPLIPGLAFWSTLRNSSQGQAMMALGVGAASTFQMRIGCVPASQPPAAALAVTRVRAGLRRKERRLRPNRTARHSHSCRRGERAVAHGFGVGFLTERPPSVRELRDVSVSGRRRGRSLRVRVETGPRAGDDEQLRVQLSLLCRG
jgi:hypothetical protein